jgi:hypothetical protein
MERTLALLAMIAGISATSLGGSCTILLDLSERRCDFQRDVDNLVWQ